MATTATAACRGGTSAAAAAARRVLLLAPAFALLLALGTCGGPRGLADAQGVPLGPWVNGTSTFWGGPQVMMSIGARG